MIFLKENSALKNTLHEHVLSHFKKSALPLPKAAPSLQIGQKVHAAAAEKLGEGEGASDSRLKGIAKALGGVGISVGITLGMKALIPIVLTAALPAALASVSIPIALVLFTGYGLAKDVRTLDKKVKACHQRNKEKGMPTKEALLEAIKENKIEAGAFVGAVALSMIGLGQNAGEFASAIAGSQEVSGVAAELAKNGASKFLVATAMSGAQVVATDGILDTMIIGGERVIDREHKERLAERAALSHKSLTDIAVCKKLNAVHPARILKAQMKRFSALPQRKVNKLPAKPAAQRSSPKV